MTEVIEQDIRVFALTQSQAQFLQKHLANNIADLEDVLKTYKDCAAAHYENCNKDLKNDPIVRDHFAEYSFFKKHAKYVKKHLKFLRGIQYSIKRNI